MESAVPLYLQITLIASQFLLAACALGVWLRGSRSTRQRRPQESPAPTPPSEAHLARLEADQAELFSTLEKLTTTVKRLSSRAGMRDVRARSDQAEPPPGASKAELLRHYGMAGKVGPEFARAQQSFEYREKLDG